MKIKEFHQGNRNHLVCGILYCKKKKKTENCKPQSIAQCWVKGFRKNFLPSSEYMLSIFFHKEHIPEDIISTQLY